MVATITLPPIVQSTRPHWQKPPIQPAWSLEELASRMVDGRAGEPAVLRSMLQAMRPKQRFLLASEYSGALSRRGIHLTADEAAAHLQRFRVEPHLGVSLVLSLVDDVAAQFAWNGRSTLHIQRTSQRRSICGMLISGEPRQEKTVEGPLIWRVCRRCLGRADGLIVRGI